MILAGIDEAGLGPALGPLCVCCTALRVPDGWTAQQPWEAFSEAVKTTKGRKDPRLFVADSKVVHRAEGAAGLERTVLSFLHARDKAVAASRDTFLDSLAAFRVCDAIPDYPWYRDAAWEVPSSLTTAEVESSGAILAETFLDTKCGLAVMEANVLLAGMLNDSFSTEINKAEVLLGATGGHLQMLAASFPDEEMVVTVDKQGGRNYYLPYLMDLFPGAWVQMQREGPECSEYHIMRPGGGMTIRFLPKADASAFCVALASMLAKYLRERFMDDLNSFFGTRLEGVKPTAGYHGDAPRFLGEISPILEAEGIDRRLLVRER